MTKKIHVQKEHSKFRFCKDRKFNLRKQFSFLHHITLLVNPKQRFFLMSIINSIPTEWHSVLKTSIDVTVIDPHPNTPTIKTESDNLAPILDASSKQIYQLFLWKQEIPPTAKQKVIGTQTLQSIGRLGLFVSLPNHFSI